MQEENRKFTIQGELCDLNTYTDLNRKNLFMANAMKQSETRRVAHEAWLARLQPIEKYPVRIHFRWYSKNRKKDIDNIAFAKKFLLDGLVQARVLKNDSQKFISGFSDDFFIDKDHPRVEVEIRMS